MDLGVLNVEVIIEVIMDVIFEEKSIEKGRVKEKVLIRIYIWVLMVRGKEVEVKIRKVGRKSRRIRISFEKC